MKKSFTKTRRMATVMALAAAVLAGSTPFTQALTVEAAGQSTVMSNTNSTQAPNFLNTYGAEYGYIGTCINLSQLQDPASLAIVKQNYNSITLENEMKPDSILRNWSKKLITVEQAKALGYYIPAGYKDTMVPELNFATIDQVMKICCENNIGLRAHTLVWHSQTPKWFFRAGYNESSSFVDAATMDARMEMYIKTVMNHVYSSEYGKCVYAWDVVNEYPHADDQNWIAIYGKKTTSPEFVKKAFEYAYETLEKYNLQDQVTLFFNDYNTYMEVSTVLDTVNYINSDKMICKGIGMQSHCATWFPTPEYYTAAMKSFTDAGYEVQITEMDVKSNRNPQEQATYVYNLYKLINTMKKNGAKITGVTWWGLSDQVTWIAEDNPLLFKTATETKPAYDSFLKAYTDVFGGTQEITNPDFPVIDPVDPTPVDPTPVDPTPVDPTPVDPTPVDPTPVDPTPVDPTPVDPTPVDPTPVVTGLKVTASLTDWGSGFQYQIEVKNEGPAVDTWEIRVKKSDVTISSSWCVNIEEEGDEYVITPVSWNSHLEKGMTTSFGIQGAGGKHAENVVFTIK